MKAEINKNHFTCSQLLPMVLLLLATTCLLFGGTHSALAAGTVSGTTISLGATADYKVGGVDMPQVNTATPAAFMVDTIVDLTVAESGSNYTIVTPGSAGQVLIFTVANDGGYTVLTNIPNEPADYGSSTSNIVSVGNINLSPGDHADIQFRVVIQ